MAGNNYSVDDILAEIRRKKENGAGSVEFPVKNDSSENGGDFFEMRQKNTQPEEVKEPEAPTYTKKFNDEPITTRTIQVDDTLSQYFGAATWKNEKKSKKQKEKEESISSKVTTVPAHETKKEKIDGFVPRDFTIHTEEQLKGFEKSAQKKEEPKIAEIPFEPVEEKAEKPSILARLQSQKSQPTVSNPNKNLKKEEVL